MIFYKLFILLKKLEHMKSVGKQATSSMSTNISRFDIVEIYRDGRTTESTCRLYSNNNNKDFISSW